MELECLSRSTPKSPSPIRSNPTFPPLSLEEASVEFYSRPSSLLFPRLDSRPSHLWPLVASPIAISPRVLSRAKCSIGAFENAFPLSLFSGFPVRNSIWHPLPSYIWLISPLWSSGCCSLISFRKELRLALYIAYWWIRCSSIPGTKTRLISSSKVSQGYVSRWSMKVLST